MQIPITEPVVYDVATVDMSPVNVRLMDDELRFSMTSVWLDAEGNKLQMHNLKHIEPQVASMFAAVGQPWTPFAAAFRALLPTDGQNPQATLDHDGTNLIVRAGSAKLDPSDGRTKWRAVLLTKEQVDAKLKASGVTSAQLWAALQGVVRKELE